MGGKVAVKRGFPSKGGEQAEPDEHVIDGGPSSRRATAEPVVEPSGPAPSGIKPAPHFAGISFEVATDDPRSAAGREVGSCVFEQPGS